MQKDKVVNISRRQFLTTSLTVGAGLTLGVNLFSCGRQEQKQPDTGSGKADDKMPSASLFQPNAFLRIGTDNTVTVIIKHLEMGQGTYTGLATLVAEELDAAWEQVSVEGAPANAALYNNLLWGPMQGTGGSTAIANSYTQMRKAGGTARAMLVAAAAEKWQVPGEEINVQAGQVIHNNSGKKASFGELAELAAAQTVPEEVFLKDVAEFKLIGSNLPRKDNKDKITGRAIFTQDIKLPDMLTALVAHPPRFGARLKSFDSVKAKAIKGVVDVVAIPTGVAVLAKDFWTANTARNALQVDWDETDAMAQGSEEILADYKRLALKPGAPARKDGDADKALSNAAKTVEAAFEFPYLAHAAMEPLNCVIQITDGGAEIWNGEQNQTADQMAVAQILGLKTEQVKINMLYAGGSFGRRSNPHSDYVVEAATIAKAAASKNPIKLVWTREDDMRGGYYRPLYYHQIKAGLDKQGNPIAWQHRIVGQSLLTGTFFEKAMVKDGIDQTSVEGAANMPYAIDNVSVDLHSPQLAVPVQWWRSVGSTHTAFAVETIIDELAIAANQDPLAFRRRLLAKHPRHLGVLELAAQKANWGTPLGSNRGRGIAVHESFNTYVAQVAEVTVHKDQSFSVDRVVIAVDCGVAVNPDIIRAQMEGGMGFGLSAALSSKLTLNNGQVVQSNFHNYTVLRIDQMPPAIEVHIIKSTEAPTGVGEPATPVIAPAVANALYAATGQRLHKLPLSLST